MMDEKAHFRSRQNTNSNEVQLFWQTHFFFTLENSSRGKNIEMKKQKFVIARKIYNSFHKQIK